MASGPAWPYLIRMLHSIRTGPLPAPSHEPIDLLLSCHAKLRHFSELSLALATRADLGREEAADASVRLLRYFRIALPLHEADEEQSIGPALLATPARSLVEDALGTMAAQHQQLHEILEALMPAWEQVEAEPGAERPALADARALATLLDLHLGLEEQTIFPSILGIDPAKRKLLYVEMRGRRTPEVMETMQKVVGG